MLQFNLWSTLLPVFHKVLVYAVTLYFIPTFNHTIRLLDYCFELTASNEGDFIERSVVESICT